MLALVRKLSKLFWRTTNISIISNKRFIRIKEDERRRNEFDFVKSYPTKISSQMLASWDECKSQLRQDLFALAESGFKKNGFFIEFGATNGIGLSNSYLLETKFGWKGILAEPGRNWWTELNQNRTAKLDTRCVWSKTGENLSFLECNSPELSTIAKFRKSDKHKRVSKDTYQVETVSLMDLLKFHNAPCKIDYLSVDTEGSEFNILDAFDFNAYDIKCITCEHNRTPARAKIYELLTRNGYRRKFEELSLFDDWYVKN